MNKRRHELEENELANFLGKQIGAAKENPDDIKKFVVPILLVVIAACGVWVAYFLVQTMSQPTPGSWLPVMVAVTSSDSPEATRETLETIADTPDEPAALWAKQMRADSFLQEGSAQLFAATEADRKKGLEMLKSAQEEFASVRAQAEDQGKDALLIRRATFGEAQAFEALAQPDKAVKIYAELAENAADSAVGEASKKKLSFLAHQNAKGEWVVREDVANFMKEYQAFVPKPPALPTGTGVPPIDPAADVLRADPAPDLSFPGMEEFKILPGGSGTDTPAGGDFAPGESSLPLTPAPSEEGAAAAPETSSTPEGTTPEAPAEGAAPAAETPAEPAPGEEKTPETTTPETPESAAP